MPDRIEDILRECTVLINAFDEKRPYRSGTGFFVAPGHIITAGHVVSGASEIMITWERDDAPELRFPARKSLLLPDGIHRTGESIFEDYPNIAILTAEGQVEHPCVAIDLDLPQLDDIFQVFAYSSDRGSFNLAPERLSYVGVRGTRPKVFLDLASGLIRPGMSGAALLNRRTGAVCGIITISKDSKQALGGLAVPWSPLSAQLAEILDANRAFHDRDRRWALAAGRPQEAISNDSPEHLAGSAGDNDDSQPNLLFRFYVPAERLYAAEAHKLLSLFRDWLITTGISGVRQSGYRTASGEMYEFFANMPLTKSDLSERIGDFSMFLALCASDPSAAAKMLGQQGIGLVPGSDLVARFGREVRRLQVDLRHERERRILTIRHSLEEELLEEGVDLSGNQSDQLNALLENFVPGASAPASLALLTARHDDRSPVPVTVNINPQIISAAQSTIIQSVRGNVNVGAQARELLDLIERFGGPGSASLQAAVYELEDVAAPPTARTRARDRLMRFLRQLGATTKDVGVEVLEKYIEHKMGLSG